MSILKINNAFEAIKDKSEDRDWDAVLSLFHMVQFIYHYKEIMPSSQLKFEELLDTIKQHKTKQELVKRDIFDTCGEGLEMIIKIIKYRSNDEDREEYIKKYSMIYLSSMDALKQGWIQTKMIREPSLGILEICDRITNIASEFIKKLEVDVLSIASREDKSNFGNFHEVTKLWADALSISNPINQLKNRIKTCYQRDVEFKLNTLKEIDVISSLIKSEIKTLERNTSPKLEESNSPEISNFRIFISYRREDSGAAAGRLYDFLSKKIDKKSIFKDIHNINYGKDFKNEIKAAIDESDIVLVIIGRYFITDENRLFKEDDYVRYEISYALRRKRIVIPVLVNDANMPNSNNFPAVLKGFSTINGPKLRNEKWTKDCDDFFHFLKRLSQKLERTKRNTLNKIQDSKKQESKQLPPQHVIDLEKKIKELNDAKNHAVKIQNYEQAADYRDKEKKLQRQFEFAKAMWEEELKGAKIGNLISEILKRKRNE